MQEIRDGTGTIYLALEELSSCHRKLALNICDMGQQPQREWQWPFVKDMLWAKHCAKCAAYTFPLNSHNRFVLYISQSNTYPTVYEW